MEISIHAPLTGCDLTDAGYNYDAVQFQSTHPLRDATKQIREDANYLCISIHAPLTGCDEKGVRANRTYHYFNPRTPYGMRLSYLI